MSRGCSGALRLAGRCLALDASPALIPPSHPRQLITPELNTTAEVLLRRLLEWQERARAADPTNFKRKRRLVSGMREVRRLF